LGPGLRLAIAFAGAALVALIAIAVLGLGGDEVADKNRGSGRAALDRELKRQANLPPRDEVAIVKRRTTVHAKPGGRTIAKIGTKTEFKSARVLAVVGRRGDWLRVLASELPNGRTGWVDARDTQAVAIDYSMSVDLSARRLEVKKNGRVVRRIRTAVGEHGTPTPTGLFAVTDKVPFLDRGSPYGCCALALTAHQPNTPSEWTGGDRIAIHATPIGESIGRPVTLGCMRVATADARWLMSRLPLGTQVSIRA
jgi:lipoprotein-anchoring transpeptidase ErfK/SrfK